jgi:hypothetical protein
MPQRVVIVERDRGDELGGLIAHDAGREHGPARERR